MYILVAIFYIALLSMGLMVVLKRREVNTGKVSIFSRMGKSVDHKFEKAFSSVGRIISYINRHTFIALSHLIAYHVLLRIRNIYVEMKHRALMNPHGRKLIDAVRGRGEVRTHGASLYLRRISTEGK